MNIEAFFLVFLFGLAAIFGLALAGFWAKLALSRRRDLAFPWYEDRYSIICWAFVFVSGGQATIDLFRLIGNVEFGLSRLLTNFTAYGIFGGMTILLLGLTMMIWLVDLETHPPRWTWTRRALVFTIIWFAASFFLHRLIPLVS